MRLVIRSAEVAFVELVAATYFCKFDESSPTESPPELNGCRPAFVAEFHLHERRVITPVRWTAGWVSEE